MLLPKAQHPKGLFSNSCYSCIQARIKLFVSFIVQNMVRNMNFVSMIVSKGNKYVIFALISSLNSFFFCILPSSPVA